jgi:uncharacterized protein YyaL (SSP411 family)
MRVTLWKKRLKRIRPLLDDKILTDWNGMMIAALAKAAAAFQEPKYVARAERAWQFIQSTMITSRGELLHRYRDSEASIHGFLDDYAALAFGLFELYQATGEQEYLVHSTKLTELLLEKFEDEKGGLYQTEILREATPFSRQKQVYDGAIPSGNSIGGRDDDEARYALATQGDDGIRTTRVTCFWQADQLLLCRIYLATDGA